ncbi:RNA polymerase sigma factor [Candidatus Clostridium stratigraminis]|uniref:RNA polymerase sigma factor n=1 Tax=Candidatus Clostridium stratigraminis TaxID=3381661 RepID=A0ABW8T4Y9_9CLOT
MSRGSLEKQIVEFVIKNKESHYRLAYSYVRNVEDALDIVQESIFKAISSMDSLKEPSYIKTWFYRIIINTSLDFLRKQKKLKIIDERVLESFGSEAIDQYEDFDLKIALNNLPDAYRSVIILRYFEDLKLKEIAEVLNENVSTVKNRLYKAHEKLRLKLIDNEFNKEYQRRNN